MAADPTYDPTEFQAALEAWLARTGFSEKAAGDTVGISQGIINRWRKPRGDTYLARPSVALLEKLAPHIGISALELKRMTGQLTAQDRALLAGTKQKPMDLRLQALFTHIEERWHALDEDNKQRVEDVTRAVLGSSRHRRPRGPGRSRKNGDSPLHGLLTSVAA